MTRGVYATAGAVVLLASLAGGCRAVIGYEDVSLVTDGGGISTPTDGGATNDGGGAIADTGANPIDTGLPPPPPDSGPADSCGEQPDLGQCLRCCRTAYPQAFAQLNQVAMGQCYCGGQGCDTECNAWCPSPSTAPPPVCGQCTDVKLKACTAALKSCRLQAGCTPAADCTERCPK